MARLLDLGDKLREIPCGRTYGQAFTRHFVDRLFSLYAWYDPPETPWGFQLLYHLPGQPSLCATYRPDRRWSFACVSEGGRSHHQVTGLGMSAIDEELFDKAAVLELFTSHASELEEPLRGFVVGRLAAAPDRFVPCVHCDERAPAFLRCAHCGLRVCLRCAERADIPSGRCPENRKGPLRPHEFRGA